MIVRVLAVLLMGGWLWGQKTTENVQVGTYLYGNLDKVEPASGGLVIRFASPSATRYAVAYGWANRKLRKSRTGTTEEQRENMKPRLAEMSAGGRVATFRMLPPDFYDVIVIDYGRMTLHEGLSLHHLAREDNQPEEGRRRLYDGEISKVLCGSREDKIAAWEGFFDTKRIERIQYAEDQAGVLLQQMRTGKALAESGTKLAGNIHSLDVVWVQRTFRDGHGWQVINRQQLYRGEIENDRFFQRSLVEDFSGIRIGSRMKTLRKTYAVD